MQVTPLSIADAVLCTPVQHADDRGVFLESFRSDVLTAAVGRPLHVAQVNTSVSQRGVVRGVHLAEVPVGQAKFVMCVVGAVLDIVVDLRQGSPTFGRHEVVTLDARTRSGLFLAEGLGHAFCSLADGSTVSYLCSTAYDPAAEFGVHPLDPDLALPWPVDLVPVLSPKDQQAPSLAVVKASGRLPSFEACQARYDEVRRSRDGLGQ